MKTTYTYRLEPAGTILEVVDEVGPVNTWEETGDSGKLKVRSGIVTTKPEGQVLHSGPPDNAPVVTLLGASWDSKAGDSGPAACHLCSGTPDRQTWHLESVV